MIARLKVDSSEYDAKIKRAAQGLQHMEQYCRKTGVTMDYLTKEEKKYIQSLGRMETVSTSARGKIAELTAAYTDLRAQYNRLTDAEKRGDFGRTLNGSLQQLNARIIDAKREVQGITQEMSGSKFGQLGSVIDGIGQRFGVTGNLTEMITSRSALLTGAIGALTTAVVKGGEAWATYNAQLARQDEITSVTTGLNGGEADRMTDQAKALAQTYGTDFREVINAANTLMTQFGKTGDESMKLLRDGMRGMIHGDGPKLLSMIQQFAPSFQSAGVSAAQLVAVIQNSEGGIFTDQNMQSIVMGIKNIRLMTNATAEALAKVGIDGRQMTKQMNDGSLTVFEALKKVAGALSKVDGNSQAAGEVMQAVFGRQGMMAGTNLGKAIAELNTNLEQTKTQTGEVGRSFDDLYEANVKLNKAIRDAFQYDGWDQMANGIKGKLISALAECIKTIDGVKSAAKGAYEWMDMTLGVGNWIEAGAWVADKMAQNFSAAYSAAKMLYEYLNHQAEKEATRGALEEQSGVRVLDVVNKANSSSTPSASTYSTSGSKSSGSSKTFKAESISSKSLQGEPIGPTESLSELRRLLQEAQQVLTTSTDRFTSEQAEQTIRDLKAKIDLQPLALRLGVSTEEADRLKSKLDESIDSITEGLKPIELTVTTKNGKGLSSIGDDAKDVSANVSKAAGAVSQLGSALAAMEDPGVKVAGMIANAIGSVAMTFASSLKGTVGPWDWIAAAIAGTATMISTIAAIHSATGYAEGGLIPGNSYSGDNQLARVNAGEIILNRAQQSNVAAALENPAQAAPANRPSFVRGQDIYLGLNNYLRASGRGQLITSRH